MTIQSSAVHFEKFIVQAYAKQLRALSIWHCHQQWLSKRSNSQRKHSDYNSIGIGGSVGGGDSSGGWQRWQ